MTKLTEMAGRHTPVIHAARRILCPKCRDEGFTGALHALVDGGTLIAIAWRDGVACSCSAGAEFARNQMEWMR